MQHKRSMGRFSSAKAGEVEVEVTLRNLIKKNIFLEE
jgi:hypothetical protein